RRTRLHTLAETLQATAQIGRPKLAQNIGSHDTYPVIYRCMFVLHAFAACKPPQASMHGAALAEPGCSDGLDASARPPRSSVRIRFRVTAFARYLLAGAMRECADDPAEISPGVSACPAGQGAPADRAAAPRRTLGHALSGPPRR